jgi:ethanolamine utilization protein EutQ (cupin superfamily)
MARATRPAHCTGWGALLPFSRATTNVRGECTMPKSTIKFVKRAKRKFVKMDVSPGTAKLGRDVDVDISSTMGGGVCEFTNIKMPWTVKYDEYFYGLTGTLTIRVGRKAYHIKPGDGLWLPANTKLVYETKGKATAVYMVYPVNWRQIEAKKAKKKR